MDVRKAAAGRIGADRGTTVSQADALPEDRGTVSRVVTPSNGRGTIARRIAEPGGQTAARRAPSASGRGGRIAAAEVDLSAANDPAPRADGAARTGRDAARPAGASLRVGPRFRRAAGADPVRIVGGRWRGRPLLAPRSPEIRPTADRLRETLFNILSHAYDDPVSGARVLDLFAGTGAMGFEALSRGAAFALFVDESAEARGLIRATVEALGAGGVTRLFRRDATRMGPIGATEPFTLVFCDPPYGRGLAERALSSCREGGWLKAGALVVVEEATASRFAWPDGYEELERRPYGETEVAFGRLILDRS
jgi:16S rRNA (guanine966-N2)-methyltransferase